MLISAVEILMELFSHGSNLPLFYRAVASYVMTVNQL